MLNKTQTLIHVVIGSHISGPPTQTQTGPALPYMNNHNRHLSLAVILSCLKIMPSPTFSSCNLLMWKSAHLDSDAVSSLTVWFFELQLQLQEEIRGFVCVCCCLPVILVMSCMSVPLSLPAGSQKTLTCMQNASDIWNHLNNCKWLSCFVVKLFIFESCPQ